MPERVNTLPLRRAAALLQAGLTAVAMGQSTPTPQPIKP